MCDDCEDCGLTEVQAARFLGVSPGTLRNQRSKGNRPGQMKVVPYVKYGDRGVRYILSELKAYRDKYRVDPGSKNSVLTTKTTSDNVE